MRKQSIKHGVWHIGGRKRQQRGRAFPLATLAAPILGNLGRVILKIIIGGGRRNNTNDDTMVRDKILLRRRVDPQNATLTDSRTFYARYQRVSRKNLPANVTIKKVRTIGLRQQ